MGWLSDSLSGRFIVISLLYIIGLGKLSIVSQKIVIPLLLIRCLILIVLKLKIRLIDKLILMGQRTILKDLLPLPLNLLDHPDNRRLEMHKLSLIDRGLSEVGDEHGEDFGTYDLD